MFHSFIPAQANTFLVGLSKHQVPGFQQFACVHTRLVEISFLPVTRLMRMSSQYVFQETGTISN